jgi:polar amino acid transport system substrate-binding protein
MICNTTRLRIINSATFLLIPAILIFSACFNASESTLSQIKDAGKITFAVEGTYPPFSFYSKQNELVGFDVDVAKEIAKRLDVEAEFVTVKWSKMISGLNAGEFDCIVASMAVTDDRLKLVAFSKPYYYSSSQLIVRSDASFQDPKDLNGKTIGVVAGTTYEADAKRLGANPILLYKDDYECLQQLHQGVLDGVITDKVLGAYLKNIGQLQTRLLGPPLRQEKIAVAFRKQDVALLRTVNKILRAMAKDDILNTLISKVAQGNYSSGKFRIPD